jgi:hypothetical protein
VLVELDEDLPDAAGGSFEVDLGLAAAIVWLDAFVENVDRTPRNVNLLRYYERREQPLQLRRGVVTDARVRRRGLDRRELRRRCT